MITSQVPTWMAMCKASMDAAHGIEYSTVVTTMARNGYEFGLRISGLPGQWFTDLHSKLLVQCLQVISLRILA